MTSEHLLDAMGLLDDDLIQEAETYRPVKLRPNYRALTTLAACFAAVIVLGYGALRLGFVGTNGSSGGNANGGVSNAPASSAPTSGAPADSSWTNSEEKNENSFSQPPFSSALQGTESGSPPTEHFRPAIMVDSVLYYSTGTPIPGEVDESAIRTVTAYINTLPQMDGQTNFSEDLSAQYALTDMGLVVRMEHEWILFEPDPS